MVLWGAISLLTALAFAFVTGILNPEEKVNGLWLVVAAGCFYALAFRFYGRFLANRVMNLDDQRELLSNLVYGQPSSGDSVWLLNFLSVHKWSSVDHFCEIGKPT